MTYTDAELRRGKLVDAVTVARLRWQKALKVHQIDYTSDTEALLKAARISLTEAEDVLWEFDHASS